jgi:hypothetical protein
MLDITFVSGLVETIYDISPVETESIQRYTLDWRGIFWIREENGQRWVLRLIKHADAAKNFRATATFLGWLNQLGYPAPSVRLTRNQQLVGIRGDWTMLLLSFIEGKGITSEPFDLRLLSARLGQLHALDHNSAPAIRLSRCHPETIAPTRFHNSMPAFDLHLKCISLSLRVSMILCPRSCTRRHYLLESRTVIAGI